MKRFHAVLLILLLATASLHAARRVVPTDEFMRKYREAAAAYYAEDYDRVLALMDEAEKIQAGTEAVPNLRGAVALDRGDFEEAKRQFEEALKRNPLAFPPKFNLIDILFRQKKYADARSKYETLLAQDPKNELVQYRIFLTYLLERNAPEAERIMNAIKFPGSTPAYYFAHGCWALAQGNTEEATSYIRAGESIFGWQRCRLFFEPMETLGWISKRKPPAEPQQQR